MIIVEYKDLPEFIRTTYDKKNIYKVQRKGVQYIVYLKTGDRLVWRHRKSGWVLDSKPSPTSLTHELRHGSEI